jgi:hypothetical protein
MAIDHRVFQYPDGHEERDEIESDEHYGVGQTVNRGGIRWKAAEGGSLPDPQHVQLIFGPDDGDGHEKAARRRQS